MVKAFLFEIWFRKQPLIAWKFHILNVNNVLYNFITLKTRMTKSMISEAGWKRYKVNKNHWWTNGQSEL